MQDTPLNPFYSAKCTPEALVAIQEIREAYKNLNDLIDNIQSRHTTNEIPSTVLNVGPREFHIAKTNLEQSSMWAIKSISHYNVEKPQE